MQLNLGPLHCSWICISYAMPPSECSDSVGFSNSVQEKKHLLIGFFEIFLTIFNKMNTIHFFFYSFLGNLHLSMLFAFNFSL